MENLNELFEKCESIKTDLELHQDALAIRSKRLLNKVLKDILEFEIDLVFMDDLNYNEHIVFHDGKGFSVSFNVFVPVSIEEDKKDLLIECLDYIFSSGKVNPIVFKKRMYNLNKEGATKLLELSELTKDAAILLLKLRG
jgi:hypothetical protein